jgi:hypothetical protein
MKTIDSTLLQADPVISEVRRAKIAVAAKHHFDVTAMIRSLQERQKLQQASTGQPATRLESSSEGGDVT